jgi:hypothetical protein
MSKNRPILSIKQPLAAIKPTKPLQDKPTVSAPVSIEDKALAASKAVWDARLAELKAIRRSAGYED